MVNIIIWSSIIFMRHLHPFIQHLIDSWPSSPLQWNRLLNEIYSPCFLSQLNDIKWKSTLNDAPWNLSLVGRIEFLKIAVYCAVEKACLGPTKLLGPHVVHLSAPFRCGYPAFIECMNPNLAVVLLKCGKGLTDKRLFWRQGKPMYLSGHLMPQISGA